MSDIEKKKGDNPNEMDKTPCNLDSELLELCTKCLCNAYSLVSKLVDALIKLEDSNQENDNDIED